MARVPARGYVLLCREWSTEGGATARGILDPQLRVWRLGEEFSFDVVFFFGPGIAAGVYSLAIQVRSPQGAVYRRELGMWDHENPHRQWTVALALQLQVSRPNLGDWVFEGWLGEVCIATTCLEVLYINVAAVVPSLRLGLSG